LEEYLEKNYPEKQKSEIKEIYINDKNLGGDLKIEGFSELERLDCYSNKLTGLEIVDCPKLKELCCFDNCLEDLDFVNNLSPKKLTTLDIKNNNFPKKGLSAFSQFTNLKYLYVGNDNKEKIEKNVYNRFYGSLEPLKDLNKLSGLNISSTDVDSGLEFLSDSVGTLGHEVISDESNKYNFGVNKIREQLAPYGNSIFVCKE